VAAGRGDRRWFVILKRQSPPSATVIMLGNFQQSQELRLKHRKLQLGTVCSVLCICNNGFGPNALLQGCQNSWIKDSRSLAGLDRSLFIIKWRCDTQLSTSLLSQGIDGFHEWYWGEGWVQSRLEGVSILPLNLGRSICYVCVSFNSSLIWHFWKTLIQ